MSENSKRNSRSGRTTDYGDGSHSVREEVLRVRELCFQTAVEANAVEFMALHDALGALAVALSLAPTPMQESAAAILTFAIRQLCCWAREVSAEVPRAK